MTMRGVRYLVAVGVAAGFPAMAQAQSAAEFYKNRQIQMVVGYEVGNDYDIGARLLAKYLSKQLPGQPAVVVQNQPQAAGLVTANFLYSRAARDGSVIGGISRNLPNHALMGAAKIE